MCKAGQHSLFALIVAMERKGEELKKRKFAHVTLHLTKGTKSYVSAPGDCAKSKGESPQQERSSKPDWPRVMRSASRGARRSVDRGSCRPAMEIR